MNISLSQKEITQAIRAYVAGRGIAAGFVLSDVKFSMTRNPAAISAELSLDEQEGNPAPSTTIDGQAEKANSVGSLIADTAKAVLQTTATADEATASTAPVEEVKSVPEETAAVIDSEAAPADDATPATEAVATNTTSLFG